jgi:exonuclease SbcC
MEIKTLRLQNIFCFEDVTINFDELNFTLFVGKNGEGKSAIFDGLCWVLFDQTARKKYDKSKVVRDIPTKQMQARGWAEIYDGETKIVILRQRGKENSVKLIVNGVESGMRTDSLIQEEIERVLGMDHKTFLNIAYFSQGDIGNFLSSDSGTRISIISDILGLDVFDKATDYCSKQIRETEKSVENIKGKINAYQTTLDNYDVVDAEKDLKSNKSELNKSTDRMGQLSEILDSVRKKTDLKIQLNLIKNRYDDKKDSIQNAIDQYKADKGDDEMLLIDEDKVVEELKEYSSEIEEHQLVSERYEQLVKERETLQKDESSSKADYRNLKDKIKELEDACNMEGKECPTCHSIVSGENIHQINVRISDLGVKLNKMVSGIKKNSSALETNYNGIQNTEKEIEKISDILEKVKELKESVEENTVMKQKIENDKEKHGKYRKDAVYELAKVKHEYDGKKREYRVYKDIDVSKSTELESEFSELEDKKSDLEKRVAVTKHAIDEYYKVLGLVKELNKDLDEMQVEYSKIAFWKTNFPKVKLKMIGETVPFIEDQTNKYLSNILDGKRVTFPIDIQKAQNRFDLIIEDYEFGVKRIFEGWSGGQKGRMALAVYLALNKLASMKSGKSVNFLILDEKFAEIDSESRYLILDMVKNEYYGRKIWVISHVKDIGSQFENIVKVKMKNNISSIEVMENAGYEQIGKD